jgi:hypothetical protein
MIVANLHNEKTNRFHPIVFQEHPLPSDPEDSLGRTKSLGHHTNGFATREEAIAECKEIAEKLPARLCIEKDFSWDGEDIPAMVVFFKEIEGKLVPMF